MDASATNVWAGSVRVPHGSPWGRPKADRWPDVDNRCGRGQKLQSLPRRTGETRRGSERAAGRLAEKVVPTFSVRPTDPLKSLNNPQPENAAISQKPRSRGAMFASYIQNHAERSSPHAVQSPSEAPGHRTLPHALCLQPRRTLNPRPSGERVAGRRERGTALEVVPYATALPCQPFPSRTPNPGDNT